MPQADAFLAGDRNLETNGVPIRSRQLLLAANAALAFTSEIHSNRGNICMGDGSVQQFSNASLAARLKESRAAGTETNLLLVP